MIYRVLILIFLENALRQPKLVTLIGSVEVLILIFLENALRLYLNSVHADQYRGVLILIFLENALRQRKSMSKDNKISWS